MMNGSPRMEAPVSVEETFQSLAMCSLDISRGLYELSSSIKTNLLGLTPMNAEAVMGTSPSSLFENLLEIRKVLLEIQETLQTIHKKL